MIMYNYGLTISLDTHLDLKILIKINVKQLSLDIHRYTY